ncbi:ABC transporter ATP-binding protein [Desulfocicer niacini]
MTSPQHSTHKKLTPTNTKATSASPGAVLLDVQNITMHFGGVHALTDVSFQVMSHEFLCLIGPNGAGKTTMLKSITGVIQPQEGKIVLNGSNITKQPTFQRIHRGLSLTHQIVRPFHSMTLKDNVALAVGHRRIRNIWSALLSSGRRQEHERSLELLKLVGIEDHADEKVTGQPLGILKRLEVARALALEPQLLLLDEPLAGLNHIEAQRLADTLVMINRKGMTLVMIEHNLSQVMRVGHRLVVLDNGRKIAEGSPDKIMQMPHVRAAYVGKGAEGVTT